MTIKMTSINQTDPGTRVDPGHARKAFDLAGGVRVWVDHDGPAPTPQEVRDYISPPPAVLQAQRSAAAAQLMTGTDPADVRFRALERVTFKQQKANRDALLALLTLLHANKPADSQLDAIAATIPALTWGQFRAQILAEMPVDDPAA